MLAREIVVGVHGGDQALGGLRRNRALAQELLAAETLDRLEKTAVPPLSTSQSVKAPSAGFPNSPTSCRSRRIRAGP